MLQFLSIRNFALIEKTEIRFSEGFTVITGETGAGKSILLGALGHVIGKRADLSSLMDKEEKCVIEAHFDLSGYELEPFFEEHDLDYDVHTILRREILPSGKSRAFVNDSPVTLPDLQELGSHLIDIHSQQQTRTLSEESVQLEILDTLAGQLTLVGQFREQLEQLRVDRRERQRLADQLSSAHRDADYNQYLLEELQKAELREGMQEEWEQALQELGGAESVKEALGRSAAAIFGEEQGIRSQLREVRSALHKIASLNTAYAELLERVTQSEIEIDDIGREMEALLARVNDDPMELQRVEDRLRLLYDLQRKHQVSTVASLLDIQNKLETEVLSGDALESAIAALDEKNAKAEQQLVELSQLIREGRVKAIPQIKEQMEALLAQLGIPHARFEIRLSESSDFRSDGKDEIKWLFSANKGSEPGLLSKTASGGEMSRIMLVVKAIVSRYRKLPTIIFDEIDTGVSGEVAGQMGRILQQMASDMQVIAITHLPQIAARGRSHFRVFKRTEGERTTSGLESLSEEGRISEIAEMLSGKPPSESALHHARTLLN